jgi:hypothetical protein
MDIENIKKIVDEIFENRPNKDVFEKCLLDLITEKNKILLNEDDKNLINEIDKLIKSIEIYLSIASK